MKRTHGFALAAALAGLLLPSAFARPGESARPKHQRPPHAPARHLTTRPIMRHGKAVAPADDRIDSAVNKLLKRSDYYWHEGDYESVAATYDIITGLDPSYVQGWQDYGWLLWAGLNRSDAAMRVFQRGLAYNPDTHELYFEIGYLQYHQRRFLDAAKWMGKATEHNAPFTVWHMRAHCLEYAGEIPKAKALWKEIIRKFPNDAPAKLNLKRMEEGRINRNPTIGVEPLKPDKPMPKRDPNEITTPQDPDSV